MNNLLAETKVALSGHGYQPEQIVSIENAEGERITWQRFAEVAARDYDSGFGVSEVQPIAIHMVDGAVFFRNEYDGLEWWEFVAAPSYREPLDDPEEIARFVWARP